MKDRYYTPLNERSSGRSIPDMFGVIIHANIISMLLDEDYIDDVPEWLLYLFSFLYFYQLLYFLKVVEKNFFTVAFIRLIQILQFVFIFLLHFTFVRIKYQTRVYSNYYIGDPFV